jgi:GTPase
VGTPGDERDVELHLKLLADAALVGLPNAGKSSLITRISNARPKVADYPFTTLQPVLGTVESPYGRQLVIADVPGLIEGASEGVGLGHDFLAHLERARTLVHVIDASKPADEQWRAIDAELVAYGAGLEHRPQIVVLNKIDLEPEPEFGIDDARIVAVLRVSCATGEGIDAFVKALFELVPEAPLEESAPDELPEFLVYRPEAKARPWRLLRTERGFRVTGTPPSEEELERALREAGAKRGAEVEIGEETMELA